MNADIKNWLARDPDPNTREELEKLIAEENADELALRFAGRLAFGTAGLRGVVGAGPSRMNRLVVRETTAGLGAYLIENVENAREKGVVIGFDGRIGSDDFSNDATAVLAAMGFKVYLSDFYVSTPLTAYAVPRLGAAAGIMITASHNPPEYNGYKVYWSNGAQIIPPHDVGIAAKVDEAAALEIPWTNDPEVLKARITSIGADLEAEYLAAVQELSIHPDRGNRADITMVYTPMHGVGARPTEEALKAAGFARVYTVPSQREPDGNFPTVRFPNPEEPGAMDKSFELASEVGATLLLANDPDADRLAVATRTADGGFVMLTGDQIGALFGYDRLSHDANVAVATTIVSSRLLSVMAAKFGAEFFETLTGFKWIANGAMDRPDVRFAFGYEEAIGYTVGELVRDKDGVSAAVGMAELVAELAADGDTILGRLETIYREFGLFVTGQKSLWFSPENTKLAKLCDRLREEMPQTIAGRKISAYADLLRGIRVEEGEETPVDLPKSDVLIFWLEDGSRVIVRPSGTEPKLKSYYEIRDRIGEEESYEDAWARGKSQLEALIQAHQTELASL